MPIPPIQKQLAQKQLDKFCKTRISAKLKNDAGIKGASALVFHGY